MRKTEAMKKVLSILLVFSMVLSYVPIPAFAAAEDNLCGHHTEHTADCGYVAAVAGVTCACTEVDENGTLVHTEGCGYVAAVEGRECHYACAECAAEADAPDCTCGTDDDTVTPPTALRMQHRLIRCAPVRRSARKPTSGATSAALM